MGAKRLYLQFPVVGRRRNLLSNFIRARCGLKPQTCHWKFDAIGYVIFIFGLAVTLLFPVVTAVSHLIIVTCCGRKLATRILCHIR